MRKRTGPVTLAEIFARVTPEPNAGCWLWVGNVSPKGYGQMTVQGRTRGAHRLAFEAVHGPQPSHVCVCHRCDVPSCCNPDHMFPGSHADNAADRGRKARGHRPTGERNANARLSAADVAAIRASDEPGTVLAARYGVSRATVSMIRNHKTWREQ